MEQEGQVHQMPQPTPAASAPAISAANKFSVSVQPTDFLVSIGTSRLAFGSDGIIVANVTEFAATYSLSPTTAKQLQEILTLTVAKYESEWGAIPMDKAASAHILAMASEPLVVHAPAARTAAKKRAKPVHAKR